MQGKEGLDWAVSCDAQEQGSVEQALCARWLLKVGLGPVETASRPVHYIELAAFVKDADPDPTDGTVERILDVVGRLELLRFLPCFLTVAAVLKVSQHGERRG